MRTPGEYKADTVLGRIQNLKTSEAQLEYLLLRVCRSRSAHKEATLRTHDSELVARPFAFVGKPGALRRTEKA
jgi:hypothetical protein